MTEDDAERPPGEDEEVNVEIETVVEEKPATEGGLAGPKSEDASELNKAHDLKLEGPTSLEDNSQIKFTEPSLKPEKETSNLLPISTAPGPGGDDLTVKHVAAIPAPVDPYAGFTGYDPAAAGYDYSAYWAQYGYQASTYAYPGYYQGYEAYYDPNAYQPYAAPQAPVSVHPPQPPVGPPPVAPSPSATPLEAAPGAEDDTKEPARETEEVIQRSTAEEEERRRAEKERVKAAQSAAEEATRAAAEEAARQAAEQQRLADEAAIRAQNLAAQRANAEQAQMGPSPEVLARIQKELAEAQAKAAKKKADEEAAIEEASKAAARAEEAAKAAAPLQGASKKKVIPPKNIMLKGARMAFSSAIQANQPGKVSLNKVFQDSSPKATNQPVAQKPAEKPKAEKPGKLYMPEPMSKANRMPLRKVSPSPQRRTSRSPYSSRSRSLSRSQSLRSRSRSGGGRGRGAKNGRLRSDRLNSLSRSNSSRSASVSRSRSRALGTPSRVSPPIPPRERKGRSPTPQRSPSPFQRRGTLARGNSRQYRAQPDQAASPLFRKQSSGPMLFPLHDNRVYRQEAARVPERYDPEPGPALRNHGISTDVKTRKKDKKKRKRRHKEAFANDPSEPGTEEKRRRHKQKKQAQEESKKVDMQYDEPPSHRPLFPIKQEQASISQHAESAVNKPVIPVVKPMKAFHVPSPPRLSDLRRKYGVAISAAGQSPAYSSTPSSSRSPSPLPARSPRAQSVQGTRKASPPKASQAAALKELKESLPAKLPATVTAKQPAQKSIPLVLEAEIEETEPAPRFLAPLVITAPAAVRPVSPAPVPAPVVKLPAQVKEAAAAAAAASDPEPQRLSSDISRAIPSPQERVKIKEQAVVPEGEGFAEGLSKVKDSEKAARANAKSVPLVSGAGPAAATHGKKHALHNTDTSTTKAGSLKNTDHVSDTRKRGQITRRRSHSHDSYNSSPRRSRSRRRSRGRARRRSGRSYSRSSSRRLSWSRSRSRSRSYSSRRYSSSSRSRSRSRRRSRLRTARSSSRSCSRSLSRSRSPTPARVVRARSPVIPMRMRMDEEQPVADLTKAAQAARRAASRVSAGVKAAPSITHHEQIAQRNENLAESKDTPGKEPTLQSQPGSGNLNGPPASSRVLRLANMLERDDLLDDDDYSDNLDDITTEVEKKYGKLAGIEAPRPGKDGRDSPGVGLVFLAFESEKSAHKAQLALNGRKYGENTIQSSFFDEGLYVRKLLA